MTSPAAERPVGDAVPEDADARPSRSDIRRDQLAESTLRTLSQLGYARTSLRDIADNSDFSHGVLHYYFRDKDELIMHGVRRYKERCVTRYDGILATAVDAAGLRSALAHKLAWTAVDDGPLHRLWYDLRVQAMFVPALREDVTAIDDALEHMIWRLVERFAELDGRRPVLDRRTAYALFDGLFERTVLDAAAGDELAPARLVAQVEQLLAAVVGEPISPAAP